jgi:hypothetical protein
MYTNIEYAAEGNDSNISTDIYGERNLKNIFRIYNIYQAKVFSLFKRILTLH